MVNCIECGSRIRITITGGEFFIRDGSTEDNLNFEKPVTLELPNAEKIDEDVMLEVNVECATDPSHKIFGHIDAKIRAEIYKRIIYAAQEFYVKYNCQ
jgi:hypothetical protein